MLFYALRMTINDSNFALAKNTPPSASEGGVFLASGKFG